jgi:hypothetical protein
LIWPDLASQQPIFIAFESGTPYPFRWAESANVRTSRSSALPPMWRNITGTPLTAENSMQRHSSYKLSNIYFSVESKRLTSIF